MNSLAWCFCNSSKEHIAEFDADWHVIRFRPAPPSARQQFKAFVLYRWGYLDDSEAALKAVAP